jgi:hypothetical protein
VSCSTVLISSVPPPCSPAFPNQPWPSRIPPSPLADAQYPCTVVRQNGNNKTESQPIISNFRRTAGSLRASRPLNRRQSHSSGQTHLAPADFCPPSRQSSGTPWEFIYPGRSQSVIFPANAAVILRPCLYSGIINLKSRNAGRHHFRQ